MKRGGRHYFQPRNCWLCGHHMETREEIDFFIPGDYTGVCKDHHLKDILSIKAGPRDIIKKLEKESQNNNSTSYHNLKSIELKKKIIFKVKYPNKMRKFLINLFIFVVSLEIVIHVPHIINVLINKIK